MDLASLKAFVKVVQMGSFTRAADVLGTQKAHLSRVITQLERELGVRLLERTTRALSLTEIGREFYERAMGILAAVDDAHSAVHQSLGEPRGTLKLTCGVEFGAIAVSGWVARYLQRYPKVRVEAEYTGRIVDIVHEGFDLAIRIGVLTDSALTARRLGDLTYAVYAAPAYFQAHGALAHPNDLPAHDWLAFSGATRRAALTLHRGDERVAVTQRPRFQANNLFAVRDAALAGLGIASLPCIVAAPCVQVGQLQVLLPQWTPPPIPVHAVFASARYLAPKVRAFVDLAAQAMQETSPTT